MSTRDHTGRTLAIPSGEQMTIASGSCRATIVEVGGGIRVFEAAGVDVLDGYDLDQPCTFARGLPLIPWPNRLHRGRYTWDGVEYQAPINEVDKNNSLHGYTRFLNWNLTAQEPNVAIASLRLHPQDGYPFILDLSVTYEVGPASLTVTNSAKNVGSTACPYAHGAHPYVTVGTEKIDQAMLTLPASTYFPTDAAQIPLGRAPVSGTPFDFRESRAVEDVHIDNAFTDLARDPDGLARITLSSAATGRTVRVWIDSSYPFVMLFTGDSVEPASRQRTGLGVEPTTCPPNGFATGENVIRLESGESVTTRWGISIEE